MKRVRQQSGRRTLRFKLETRPSSSAISSALNDAASQQSIASLTPTILPSKHSASAQQHDLKQKTQIRLSRTP